MFFIVIYLFLSTLNHIHTELIVSSSRKLLGVPLSRNTFDSNKSIGAQSRNVNFTKTTLKTTENYAQILNSTKNHNDIPSLNAISTNNSVSENIFTKLISTKTSINIRTGNITPITRIAKETKKKEYWIYSTHTKSLANSSTLKIPLFSKYQTNQIHLQSIYKTQAIKTKNPKSKLIPEGLITIKNTNKTFKNNFTLNNTIIEIQSSLNSSTTLLYPLTKIESNKTKEKNLSSIKLNITKQSNVLLNIKPQISNKTTFATTLTTSQTTPTTSTKSNTTTTTPTTVTPKTTSKSETSARITSRSSTTLSQTTSTKSNTTTTTQTTSTKNQFILTPTIKNTGNFTIIQTLSSLTTKHTYQTVLVINEKPTCTKEILSYMTLVLLSLLIIIIVSFLTFKVCKSYRKNQRSHRFYYKRYRNGSRIRNFFSTHDNDRFDFFSMNRIHGYQNYCNNYNYETKQDILINHYFDNFILSSDTGQKNRVSQLVYPKPYRCSPMNKAELAILKEQNENRKLNEHFFY